MTACAPGAAAVPPWGLAVAAIGSVQLGSALSAHMIPARTARLRPSMRALIFLASGGYAAKPFPPGPSYGPIRA
jgi:inner membrane transporter RhtA